MSQQLAVVDTIAETLTVLDNPGRVGRASLPLDANLVRTSLLANQHDPNRETLMVSPGINVRLPRDP